MKLEHERDFINAQGWYTGMYVAHAIGSVFGQNHKYPSEPFEREDNTVADGCTDIERFSVTADIFNHTHNTFTDAPN